MWLDISGVQALQKRKGGGARNRSSARKAEIMLFVRLVRRSSTFKKNLPQQPAKSRTERQPSRNLLGKCLRDELSPVAMFGAAALSGLGAASTACGGEAAAEARERDPAERAVEKASAGHEPNVSRPGGATSNVDLEISASLSVTLQAENVFYSGIDLEISASLSATLQPENDFMYIRCSEKLRGREDHQKQEFPLLVQR